VRKIYTKIKSRANWATTFWRNAAAARSLRNYIFLSFMFLAPVTWMLTTPRPKMLLYSLFWCVLFCFLFFKWNPRATKSQRQRRPPGWGAPLSLWFCCVLFSKNIQKLKQIIFVPLKIWVSQLSNGAKINKNWYYQQKLWTHLGTMSFCILVRY